MKSWVTIICRHEYPYEYFSVYYSGYQNDDGSKARQFVEGLNSNPTRYGNRYILYVWDITPFGGDMHKIPERMKQEIHRVNRYGGEEVYHGL